MHVKTIRALLRGIRAARDREFEDAVLAFNVVDDCIRRSRRRIPWNVDAVLRSLIRASRGAAFEPPLDVVEELEETLLSRPESPAQSRRLFDRLWTSWRIHAYKTDTPWTDQHLYR